MAKPRPRERRRHTAQEKAAILARYERSEQTQAKFCAAEQICVPTLALWRRAAAGPHPAVGTGALVEVARWPALRPETETAVLEVNGCQLHIRPGTSPEWLGAVARQLRPPCSA